MVRVSGVTSPAVRPRSRPPTRPAIGVGMVCALLLLGGCGGRPASAPVRSPDTTLSTPTSTRTSPPTTTWVATSPQRTAEAAADALVAAWAEGNRAAAAAVASPQAVAALFAAPFPGASLTIPRGCSSTFTPVVCTFGPAGGSASSDPIRQLSVSPATAGWFVSSVSTLG
jgi:hypothetical protein